MEQIKNVFDEDSLRDNLTFAAYFILLYEHFEDKVTEIVRDPSSALRIKNGELQEQLEQEYLDDIQNRQFGTDEPYNDVFRASLIWLQEKKVISANEKKLLITIRSRRNTIVHELFELVYNGVQQRDREYLDNLLKLYLRIDNWAFQEYECPSLASELDPGADIEHAQSGSASMVLSIFRILFLNEGQEFKDALRSFGIID